MESVSLHQFTVQPFIYNLANIFCETSNYWIFNLSTHNLSEPQIFFQIVQSMIRWFGGVNQAFKWSNLIINDRNVITRPFCSTLLFKSHTQRLGIPCKVSNGSRKFVSRHKQHSIKQQPNSKAIHNSNHASSNHVTHSDKIQLTHQSQKCRHPIVIE